MTSDPFDTAVLRDRVLASWAASPARFREDANAEEDLVRGGYRDRVIVELASNAADAARAAGIPGRLRLAVVDGALVASNLGAPLDAAGVEALSTLRASNKRDGAAGGTVGRFGVGFAAVLAVTDEPRIATRTGGIRWSADETRAHVAALSGADVEVIRRAGIVPVLRLPFATDEIADEPWDTTVTLPLRDAAAEELVRRLLRDVDAALLLTVAGLSAVDIDVDGVVRRLTARRDGPEVVVEDDSEVTRWRTSLRAGRLEPSLLADRPIEERDQSTYDVLWAVPVDVTGRPALLPSTVPAVIHAPTPTDEPLGLPALLIGTFPLDPTRRHIAAGPLRDFLLSEAADGYAELVRDLPPEPSVLDLVPQGLAAGEIDAVLRRDILETLSETPFLDDTRERPVDAVILDAAPAAVGVLDDVVSGILAPDWATRTAPLAVLGVRVLTLADLSDALRDLDRAPAWWRELYDALATGHLGAPERDALGTLPVPLADGRLVSGPRGLLVPPADVDPEPWEPLGLRIVHPEAAHPLLVLLGAAEATPRAVLDQPAVAELVAASYDSDEDPRPLADAVLDLVRAAGVAPGDLPWLGDLALTATDGEIYPASELLLPRSPMTSFMADDAPFGVIADDLVESWGVDALTAVGVLDSFGVVRDADAIGPEHDLDDEAAWWSQLPESAAVREFVAVRDLEFVDSGRWSDALTMLAAPPFRSIVTEPASVDAEGQQRRVPSYTAWWLSRHPVLEGIVPRSVALDDPIGGLYDVVASTLDQEFLRVIGVRADLADVLADADGVADLLERLADEKRDLDRPFLGRVYAALALSPTTRDVPPPEQVRAVCDGGLVVVDAQEAIVVDSPDLLPLVGSRAVIPVDVLLAPDAADVLAVPLASETAPFEVVSTGRPADDHVAHDALMVTDIGGEPKRVAWRVIDDVVHVDADRLAFGLGRGVAWLDRRWQDRHMLSAMLGASDQLLELLAEADLDDRSG